MFLNKYSISAKLFACICIAVVFGLLAIRLLPIAPFIDSSVKNNGLVVAYSDTCVQVQYYDAGGTSHTICTTDIETNEIGANVNVWYLSSQPDRVIFKDPLLILLGCSLAGFGWFLLVLATLWWNTTRLENWATNQGITLTQISFVPPWNNPLGQRFRIDVILRTYKILGMDKLGREYEAWVRFKPFYLITATPRVVWANDHIPGVKVTEKSSPPKTAPASELPSGGLSETLKKRKDEKKSRDAQNDLLF
jgi:hypothetical protein